MEYKIENVEFLNANKPEERKIKVTLDNGTIIYIERCHESFIQYGGCTDELKETVNIAEKYNGWLHGEDLCM